MIIFLEGNILQCKRAWVVIDFSGIALATKL